MGGGYGNSALGDYAVVSGGFGNIAGYGTAGGGDYSAVPGGRDNLAYADYSFAAGRRAKAYAQGAFVWADSTDADYSTYAADSFNVRATNGAVITAKNGNLWPLREQPDPGRCRRGR